MKHFQINIIKNAKISTVFFSDRFHRKKNFPVIVNVKAFKSAWYNLNLRAFCLLVI